MALYFVVNYNNAMCIKHSFPQCIRVHTVPVQCLWHTPTRSEQHGFWLFRLKINILPVFSRLGNIRT